MVTTVCILILLVVVGTYNVGRGSMMDIVFGLAMVMRGRDMGGCGKISMMLP